MRHQPTSRDTHPGTEQMEALLRSAASDAPAAQHLEACVACRQEFEALASVLASFRTASTLYAEAQQADLPRLDHRGPLRHASRFSPGVRWGWTLAAGACACALAVSAPLHRWNPRAPASGSVTSQPRGARAAEISDDALLRGVQDDLAASTPSPLQSLTPSSASQQ